MADLGPADIPRPGQARDPGVRARPIQVQDPRGAALGGFAQDLAAISTAFRGLEEKRKESEDRAFVDRFQLEYSKRASAIEAEALSSPESARPDFPEYLDGRLAEAQAEAYEAVATEGGYTPSVKGKEAAEHSALNLRTTTARRASVAAHNQRVLHVANTTEQNTMAIARLAGGNGDIDGGLQRVEESVETLRGILAPDKFRAVRESARSQVIESVVLGHLERGDLDQAKKIVNRYTGFAGPGADEVKRTVIEAAEAEGVDPLVALAIVDRESGFNPNAKNPRSSAAGIYQFVSSTGGQFGLPADARGASIEAQARAGAKLTAGNAAYLKRAFGGEPSPADLYLAHFLGAGDAVKVLGADGDAPLSSVLSKGVIAANPFLEKWTVAQLWDWSKTEMQARMAKLAGEKVIDGRNVAANASALPIDTAVRLNGAINAQITARQREEEKRQKELFALVDPTKSRKDRDPVTYVARQSEEAQAAYRDALAGERENNPAARTALWERAGDIALNEQSALGVPEYAQKILPNQMAQATVQGLVAMKSDKAAQAFLDLRQKHGKHWNKVFSELAEQGLPASYQMLAVVEDNPVHVAIVSQTLNLREEDLRKDLGSAVVINSDLMDPLEGRLAEFLQVFESGPFASTDKAQSRALMDSLRKVALVHYRQYRDTGKAIEAAASMIESRFNVVRGDNVAVIVPAELQLSDGEVERAASAKMRLDYIEAFDPVPIGSMHGRARVVDFPPAPQDLSEPERKLLETHRDHLRRGTFLNDAQGITTIMLTGVTGPDGRIYNVPGFFDGKRQSDEAARTRAEQMGWQNFPSYEDGEAANKAARRLHETIEGDTRLFQSSPMAAPDFLLRQRTIRTAANSGVWVTNETGDGMFLTVPFGDQTTASVPLINSAGQRYEIRFDEIPGILKEARGGINPFRHFQGAAP